MSDDQQSGLGELESIFHGAIDLRGAARDAFLEAKCGADAALRARVERMLRADEQTDGPLRSSPMRGVRLDPATFGADDERLEGGRIGPYRIVRRLGEGGMGSVWLGEREDDEFERNVAIKVIKRGMDTDQLLRRFGTERHALASLEHVGIARLIDATRTPDGRPALIMEYIRGRPLDEHIAATSMPVRDRIRLFLRICEAVEHAHRQLVVHRDLKPSNIFVQEDGAPKLIDFGISKILSDGDNDLTLTSTDQRVMTPRYASPEQIRGDRVSISTDIFSLGIVLYEMLTGRAPFEAPSGSRAELGRIICESDPPRPSTAVTMGVGGERTTAEAPARNESTRIRRELEGDLDTIVLKALRKEPERRYGGVGELAEDLRRYLEDRPVRARADTVGYRAAKFYRRNRGAVIAGAAALVMLVTGTGVLGTLYARAVQAEEAEARQRSAAEARAFEASSVASFLEDMLESATPDRAEGRDPAALRAILENADARVDELEDLPRVRARVEHTLGSSFRLIGSYDRAEARLASAERTRRALGEGARVDLADTLQARAMLSLDRSDLEAAGQQAGEAIEIYRSLDPVPERRLGAALDARGVVALQTASLGEADALFHEAIAHYERSSLPDDQQLLQMYGKRAIVLAQQGRIDAAIEILAGVIGRETEQERSPTAGSLSLMNNLAVFYRRAGRDEEALGIYDLLVADSAALLGPEHRLALIPRSNRAVVLQNIGRIDEAESELDRVIETQARVLGDVHDDTVTSIFNLAQLHSATGRWPEALSGYERAWRLNTELFGPDHPRTLATRGAVGRTLALHAGPERRAEGIAILSECADRLTQTAGADHPATRFLVRSLGEVRAMGKDAPEPTD